MEKKSFYNNYYGAFYNRAGMRLAKGDIVFNAKGDIIEKATGDIVFNAKGTGFSKAIKKRMRDISNAQGDISKAQGDIVFNSWGEDKYKDYADYMMHDYGEIAPGTLDSYGDPISNEEEKKDSGKWLDTLSGIFGLVDKGVDVLNKYKSGKTVSTESGVDTEITLGNPDPTPPEKSMTMWYVGGGAIVLVVVLAVILKK